jgi:hypothetical protein
MLAFLFLVEGEGGCPFQAEDAVCVSVPIFTSFEILSRKTSISPPFIPLVAIMYCSGEMYHLSMNNVCTLFNNDLNISKTVFVFAVLCSPAYILNEQQ